MRSVNIIIILLILSSCVTQQKCIEKFPAEIRQSDTLTVYKDTVVYVDGEFKSEPVSFESWWMDTEALQSDTIIVVKTDTVNNYIYIESKSGNFKVKCQTDSLIAAIKDYAVDLQLKETTISQIEQLYFDQKQENNRLKILSQGEKDIASAEKWRNIGVVFKWLFFFVSMLCLLFAMIKFWK